MSQKKSKQINQQEARDYKQKNYSDSDEEQVHIIDNKSKQYKVMKMSEINESIHSKREGTKNQKQIIATIKNWTSDRTLIKLETHYFQVHLSKKTSKDQKQQAWEVSRRYSDFYWLFNALKYGYPGCVLPYFPVKSIEHYLTTKLGVQVGEETKDEQMHIRKSQLQNFINKVCIHEIFKNAEETNIFLQNSTEQFQKNKSAIEAQIQQSKASQSSTNGIVSIFERGIAWVTANNNNPSFKIEDVQGWAETQQDIKIWMKQYTDMLEKIQNMIAIKSKEIQWQGPDTQLDTIEQFKAKVISGRQYNELFVDDLREKIVKNIEYEIKCLKQLEYELQQYQAVINIINYILKFTNDTNRCNKLIRKKQKFETNMIKEWPQFKKQLKSKVRYIHIKFNEAWKVYCQKMHKIWRIK